MEQNWTNPQLDVPLSGVDVLVVNDAGRMFVCQYNQSTRVWLMVIDQYDGVKITLELKDIKLWQYVPDSPYPVK